MLVFVCTAEAAQEDEPSDPVPSDVGGDAEGPPGQDEGGEGSVEQAVENQEQQDFGWQQLEMPPQEPLPAVSAWELILWFCNSLLLVNLYLAWLFEALVICYQ